MRSLDILLVEDNPGDIELTREALAAKGSPANLQVVMDGEQALDFLYQRGRYQSAARPDLILLDLNLPKVNGRDILKLLKSDQERLDIPVIILSSSEASSDISESYRLHANCYVSKPIHFDGYMQTIAKIESFWNQCANLPNSEHKI